MDSIQQEVIDACSGQIIETLQYSVDTIVTEMVIKKLLTYPEECLINNENQPRKKLVTLLRLLKGKPTAWDILNQYFKINGYGYLSDNMKKVAREMGSQSERSLNIR